MVFVNYGGGGYWFFQHAPWNGEANIHISAAGFKDLEEFGANVTVLHENLNAHVRVFLKELTSYLIVVINVKSTPTGSHSLLKKTT